MSFLNHYLDSATYAGSEYNGGTGTGMCRYQTQQKCLINNNRSAVIRLKDVSYVKPKIPLTILLFTDS